MKLREVTHVYRSDWETVTSAFWIKHPNQLQNHVKQVETVARDIDAENQRFRVKRMMFLDYGLPGWVEMVLRNKLRGSVTEESHIDLRNKCLEVKTTNNTFSEYISSEEHCTYRPHPENPEWTLFTQRSMCTINTPGNICNILERFAMDRAGQAAGKGLKAMGKIIDGLEDSEWKQRTHVWREELTGMKDSLKEKLVTAVRPVDAFIDRSIAAIDKGLAELRESTNSLNINTSDFQDGYASASTAAGPTAAASTASAAGATAVSAASSSSSSD